MSDEYRPNGGGGGCLTFLLWAIVVLGVLVVMGGGDTHTSTRTTTDTRSGVLSGNQTELLSRNQMNILSDVWNCYGDFSCTTIVTSTETTATSANTTNVDGDRAVIFAANGAMMCRAAGALP